MNAKKGPSKHNVCQEQPQSKSSVWEFTVYNVRTAGCQVGGVFPARNKERIARCPTHRGGCLLCLCLNHYFVITSPCNEACCVEVGGPWSSEQGRGVAILPPKGVWHTNVGHEGFLSSEAGLGHNPQQCSDHESLERDLNTSTALG